MLPPSCMVSAPRLDEKPELLFLLRKVDHLELIAGAVENTPAAAEQAAGNKTIAAADLSDVFGIEMAETNSGERASSGLSSSFENFVLRNQESHEEDAESEPPPGKKSAKNACCEETRPKAAKKAAPSA